MSVEVAAALVALWAACGRKLGEKGGEQAAASAKKMWGRVNWKASAQKYAERVVKDYGTIRLIGHFETVPLGDIFTDAWVLDELTASRRHDIEALRRVQAETKNLSTKTERLEAIRAVDRYDRLFILGKPGAGKTTFLKHIAVRAATGEIDCKVPVFVGLKRWADVGGRLMDYINREFAICGFPDARAFIEQLFEEGGAILLFDGLDEVPVEDERRRFVLTEINEFDRQYSDCKVAITCRIAATEYKFEGFTPVELADFDDGQINRFAEKWFGNKPGHARSFVEELHKPEHRGLREMADRPLLLTLLCLAYRSTRQFPARQVEAYENALDALLRLWDEERDIVRDPMYRGLALDRKHQLFGSIAYHNFEAGRIFFTESHLVADITRYLATVPAIETHVDGLKALKAIEAHHGILVERADGIYSFSHLTFQEYYTARHLRDTGADGSLERLVTKHLGDQRWAEVFHLVASLLTNADFFFGLIQRRLDAKILGHERLFGLFLSSESGTGGRDMRLGFNERRLAVLVVLAIDTALAGDRGIEIDLTLDRDRDFTLQRIFASNQGVAPVRKLALILDLDHAHDLAFTLAIDLARAHDLALAIDLARNVALDHHRDRDLEPALAIDLARELALQLARFLGFDSANDRHPTPFNSDAASQAIDAVLQSIDSSQTTERRLTNVPKGILTTPERKALKGYLRASEVAYSSLQRANVTDRAAIESRLLRAPQDRA
jgi:hypothetical protein